MRKSLLVLALFAAAGGAWAQSSVTLSGVIDTRAAYGRGSVSNLTQLTNGGLNSSRLVFRGSEDLGGGMSASFWLEAGVQTDNGAGFTTNTNNQANGNTGGGGLTFARRSTVSLASGWGELRLGRDYVPQYLNVLAADPFANVGVGATLALTSNILGVTQTRSSNQITYFLPNNLGGLYGNVQYYLGENPSNAGATKDDGTGAGARLGYANGPFDVAVSTGRTQYAAGDTRATNLFGSWNFKVVKALALITRDKAGALEGRGWHIAAVVPVGVGELKAAYSRYRTDALGNPQSKKLALGYVHNLSKRTALYATLARVNNGGGAKAALNGAVTAANDASTGIDLGIRHSF